MFNFAFGVNHLPPHVKKTDLVDNYLMTLLKYLNHKGKYYVVGCFLPEGVFNFLSARYFVKNPGSLSSVLSSSFQHGLCHNGNYGELLAQYILLIRLLGSLIFLYQSEKIGF